MTDRHTFKEDVDRDARLVLAAMGGHFPPQAIAEGLTPDEAFVHHPAWLRSKPVYLKRVVKRVAALERKG